MHFAKQVSNVTRMLKNTNKPGIPGGLIDSVIKRTGKLSNIKNRLSKMTDNDYRNKTVAEIVEMLNK